MAKALEELVKIAFNFFSTNPQIIEAINKIWDEYGIINIPTKTLGGHYFWITLAEYNGYKLQQNKITHHARIIDSDDIRIAWGNFNSMKKSLERIADLANNPKFN